MSTLNLLILERMYVTISKVLKQFKKQRVLWVFSMTISCYELNCGISLPNLEPQNMCIVEVRPLRKVGRLCEVVGASYPAQLVTLYEEEIRLHRHSSGKEHV